LIIADQGNKRMVR
jgi:hypothetical protein